MRILFLSTDSFIPDHFSCRNKTLLELCGQLKQLGHEPLVACGPPNVATSQGVVVDRSYGFRIFRCKHLVRDSSALCATLRPDIAIIAGDRFRDLIEACSPLEFPLAAWFFQLDSCCDLDRSNNDILHLASSPFLAVRLRTLFGLKIEVVAPYVDKAAYHGLQRGRRVVFVNPIREKGVELAFTLAEVRPEYGFLFVESGKISDQWRADCYMRALGCGNLE
ncbi:MAG: hypothetical protein ABFS19_12220 [Thermodesulfobacteriota bacterium]